MSAQQRLQRVRERFSYRCGYCGVAEHEVGALLEIDHYRPLSAGGGEEFENLIYCCPACNRFKHDYWSEDESRRLLHPLLDDLSLHLQELEDGQLAALTPRGALHIELLHLNRASLVKLRQIRRANQQRRVRWLQIRTEILQLLHESLQEDTFLQEREERIIHLLQQVLALTDSD
ncbi:MAG: HNH endonuclease [Fimbriimonadales bacterium]|nr:HNH endonuclease [Fimbriimonadales bacterium]